MRRLSAVVAASVVALVSFATAAVVTGPFGCLADVRGSENQLTEGQASFAPTSTGYGVPDEFVWIHEFGTSEFDFARAIAADASGVYVAGYTFGRLRGQTSAGSSDAFVRSNDLYGNELWTHQFGTSAYDAAYDVTVDASGVYVVGITEGTFPGETNAGVTDAFLRKYDLNGNEVWTREFGTSDQDVGFAVAANASGVYVAGETYGAFPGQSNAGGYDAFLRKYDVDGNEAWTRQFGTDAGDTAHAVTLDASGLYVTGDTEGTLPGETSAGTFDAFLRKYDVDGNEVWTRQFGTSQAEFGNDVDADAFGVLVAGVTAGGTLPGQTSAGGSDAFLQAFDADGQILWTRQFGTPSEDVALGVAVDASSVYVTGTTDGTFLQETNAGGLDAFLRKYDAAGNQTWSRQFGTSDQDAAYSVTIDASGAYIAGETEGTLPGEISAGGYDAYVREYDMDGSELWTRQFGTPAYDAAHDVSADVSGVYVAGETEGTFLGQVGAGWTDAFLRKYNPGGDEVWIRQFGTEGDDIAYSVAVDTSGVYVAGQTYGAFPGETNAGHFDAFLRKYDMDGNEMWTRQFGSSTYDGVLGVVVDRSGVYIAGFTIGALPDQSNAGGYDAFLRKYDVDGNEMWTRQFGTGADDLAYAIAIDESGVYVAGTADGTLPGQTGFGFYDAFLRKYDTDGNEMWTRQFGTPERDEASGVAVDASGVYVAGVTEGGTLPGQTSAGGFDAFLRKYDVGGNEIWTRQFGTNAGDVGRAVALDPSSVFVVGITGGAFPEDTSAGLIDAFVREYSVDGNALGTRQFGTPEDDEAYALGVDASGLYVVGSTHGAFPGETSSGGGDAFVGRLTTPDATPPTLAIVSPQSDAILQSATVTVRGTVSDDVAVDRVEVSADGTTWFPATGTSSWTAILILQEGSTAITVRAIDTSGNAATATILVTVDTIAPMVSFVGPTEESVVTSSSVKVAWMASDTTSGIDRIEMSVDGGAPQTLARTATTEQVTLADGAHTITIMAVDRAGNSASMTVSFRVDTSFFSPSGPYGYGGIGSIIMLTVFAALTALYILRRRRKPKAPEQVR